MKIRSAFLVLCCVAIGFTKAHAQTSMWTGATNTLWSNSGNWVSGILPATGFDVIFNSSGGTSLVDNSLSLHSLTFQNTSALTLNASSTTLSFSGGTNDITFSSNSTVALNVPLSGAGTNLFVDGGVGTLTLNPGTGSNSFSGTTQVFGSATLQDAEDYSFSPNSDLYVGGGGTPGTVHVNFNEMVPDIGDVSGGMGLITIASGKTLYINGNITNTYSGVISGAGNLEKDGTSTQILTGANTYAGTTTIGPGAALELGNGTTTGSIASSGVSGTGDLSFSPSSGTPVSYSGILSGGLHVDQQGPGTATLSGANTYTAATTINGGTLQAGSSSAFGGASGQSAVNVASGATLGLGIYNNTVGSINGAGTINLGTGTLTVNNSAATTFFTGSITGSGGLNSGEASLTLSNTTNNYTGTTDVTGGSLIVTNASGNATGTGSIVIGSGATLYIGQASTTGALNPTSTITDNGTLNFFRTDSITIQNAISGTGAVKQLGTGTTKLTGSNNYSGTTTLQSGTLQAGASNVFSNASRYTFSGSSTLDLNNLNETVGTIDGASSGSITLGTGTLTVANGIGVQFDGSISGSGSMVYAGGTSILTGTNSYTGGTSVTAGTVLVAGAGSGTGSGPINISPGAYFDIGAAGTVGSVGAGTITDNGQLEFNRSDMPVFTTLIIGTGGVQVNGGGAFLTAANTYSGLTDIEAGAISIGNGLAMGARIGGNVFVNTGAALDFAPKITDSYTFTGAITGSGSVTFAGPGSITLQNTGNTYSGVTYVNAGNLSDGVANSFSPYSRMLVNSAGGSLSVNHNETVGDLENGLSGGPVSIASGKTLTIDGIYSPGPFTGVISGGGGIMIDTGSNSQSLGGANTYTGVTTMNSGELFVSSSTIGPPGSIVSGPIGTNSMVFTGDTELSSIMSPVTLANAISLNGYNLDNDDATTDLTLTGPISGIGGSITWCTNNILALVNANTFTGTVDMRLGTLLLGTNTSAGLSPNNMMYFAGGIILDSNTALSAYGGPGVAITVQNDINFSGTNAQLGNNDSDYLTLNGNIYGDGAISYAGGPTGTLTLAPTTNTFGGTFTINSGTVYAANNNAFGSATSVTLTGGAALNVETGVTVTSPVSLSGLPNVLAGSGTITSAITAGSSAVISPSASPGGGPGQLTFSGGLTLATGSAIHFDIYDATGSAGTGFGLINATGGLILTAAANSITFNIVSTDISGNGANAINFNSANMYAWTFASASSISGFAANQFHLVNGFTNNTNGGTFSVAQVGNYLNLDFTPVPEPSTWALMGAGIAALTMFGLRRRRQTGA